MSSPTASLMGTVLTQYSTREALPCWSTPNPTISCQTHPETAVIASSAKRAVKLIRTKFILAPCARAEGTLITLAIQTEETSIKVLALEEAERCRRRACAKVIKDQRQYADLMGQ